MDHIVPHSKGGPSTFENLQILCSKCNRAKGNRSQTDFRVAEPPAPGLADCTLCKLPPLTDFPSENDLARAVWATTEGTKAIHILPKRHVTRYLDLTSHEVLAMHDLLRVALGKFEFQEMQAIVGDTGHAFWSGTYR